MIILTKIEGKMLNNSLTHVSISKLINELEYVVVFNFVEVLLVKVYVIIQCVDHEQSIIFFPPSAL